MKQLLVTTPTPAFTKTQFTAKGYSTHMNFVYDKKVAAKFRRLKEWDFYQICFGDYVLQLTMGHVSYCAQLSANLLNLKTGERRSFSKLLLNARKLKRKMGDNPEKTNVLQWFDKNVKMQFEVTPRYRRLTLSEIKKNDIRTEIDVTLTNAAFTKEKTVIAIPYENPKFWYLNYKENCFVANGYCRIDDKEVEIKNGNAVLDWGRGVWPRKHCWVWGNGSTVVDGKHFGFNIGWGFGDTSNATENMFFYDNKAYKLSNVHEAKAGDGFRYADDEKNFVFEVAPIFDNFTETKAPFVHNTCHQVFGLWKGTVKLPDGTTLKVPPFVAFCEHANNKW